MTQKRLTDDMTTNEALLAMAESEPGSGGRNAGALEVLALLVQNNGMPSIYHMDEIGVQGADINVLFMYVADGDLLKMLILLEASRLNLADITGERIRKAIDDVKHQREQEQFDFVAIQNEIRQFAVASR